MKILNSSILSGFIKRGGHFIFSSSIISKIANFLLSIIVVRFISKEDYGFYTYAMTIILFISPFQGLGLNHSLLRFGSILKDKVEKEKLYYYTLKYGLYGSLVFFIIILLFSKLLVVNKPGSFNYLILLAIGLVVSFPYLLLLSNLRIFEKNKLFSKIQMVYSIVLLIIVGGLTYKFEAYGNIIGRMLVPLSIYFIFVNENILKIYNKIKSIKIEFSKNKEVFKYALFVGFGAVASQFAVLSDNIIIGNLIVDSKELATYKVATLIPMNLVFLPIIFFTTDFVYLAKNYLNTKFLETYYYNYLKIFVPVTFLSVLFIYFLSDFFIPFLFGEEYTNSVEVLKILSIGLIGLFLLRIPLGNILAAIGKANWNSYSSMFMIIINIALTLTFVKKYGIKGAAYATVLVFWISGIINLFLFYYYLRSNKSENNEIIE